MTHANCILFMLWFCVSALTVLTYAKKLELIDIERNQPMTHQTSFHQAKASWIDYIKSIKPAKVYKVKDKLGQILDLELQILTTQSSSFIPTMLSIADLAAAAFTLVELQFLQQHPEAIVSEPLYKEPLAVFQKSNQIEWHAVKEKVHEILHNLYTKTDWSKFSAEDVYIVAMIKDQSKSLLGFVTFFIKPSYKFGESKVIAMGVTPEYQNRGIGKLLMSSLFKMVPKTQRIFLTTRATNEKALTAYRSWGFKESRDPVQEQGHVFNHNYWIFLEYTTQQEAGLQKLAQTQQRK
jgi:ribosomal protein S18 acetylase RimI-like enzyme